MRLSALQLALTPSIGDTCWRRDRVAEGNGLLNRHTGNPVSRVRIPPSPPNLISHDRSQFFMRHQKAFQILTLQSTGLSRKTLLGLGTRTPARQKEWTRRWTVRGILIDQTQCIDRKVCTAVQTARGVSRGRRPDASRIAVGLQALGVEVSGSWETARYRFGFCS